MGASPRRAADPRPVDPTSWWIESDAWDESPAPAPQPRRRVEESDYFDDPAPWDDTEPEGETKITPSRSLGFAPGLKDDHDDTWDEPEPAEAPARSLGYAPDTPDDAEPSESPSRAWADDVRGAHVAGDPPSEAAGDDEEPSGVPARSLGYAAEDADESATSTTPGRAWADPHQNDSVPDEDARDDGWADDEPVGVPARSLGFADESPREGHEETEPNPARALPVEDELPTRPSPIQQRREVIQQRREATEEAAEILHLPTRARRVRLGFVVGSLAAMVIGVGAALPNMVPGIASAMPSLGADVPSPAPLPPVASQPALAPDRAADIPQATPQALSEISVVAGIPEPCSIDVRITDAMTAAQIADRTEQQWGFTLTGPQWRQDDYRAVVKLFAETLDAVDCTDYLDRVRAGNGGTLEISSLPTRSWAWGDYGLTRPGVLTLDLEKFREGYADGHRGRLVRLIIHELAHSLNADRHANPAYWQAYNKVWNANGPVSDYGSVATESFADAIGYYVARCAADNPYATTQHNAYYDYVQTHIFDGREFGGEPGTEQDCAVEGR